MDHTPTLPDLGPEEHDLRDLMVRALRDAEPPGGLADAAVRGRGLRRRRRATAGLATLASAAAAVAVAVALTGGNTERTGQAVDPAAPPSSAAPDTPAPPPAAEPTRPPGIPADHWRQFPREWKEYFGAPTPAWIDVPAAELRDRLAPLLPDGVRIESAELTSTDVAPGESPEVRGSVLVVLADAAGGRASLEVMLRAPVPEPPEPGSITVRGRNGNEVGYAVPEPGDAPGAGDGAERLGDITVVTATVPVPGGWVYVSTSNTLDDKWGARSPASAPASLLTLAEVEAIAADDTWVG